MVDFNSSAEGMKTLEDVKRARPGIRQIVIGPEHDDELVLDAITAGARAYLDSSADPHTVRMAIDIVVRRFDLGAAETALEADRPAAGSPGERQRRPG